MSTPSAPSRRELEAARSKTVADVIAPGLKVLFVGINPGLYTAAIGHHFGRPGNRFWPAIYLAGYTSRIFSPYEERELLEGGYGITNVVARPTAVAAELKPEEYRQGGRLLIEKIQAFRPRCVAILGIGAYRTAFGQPKAVLGRQLQPLGGALLWVLPNPSGLNAHFQLEDLGRLYAEPRLAVEA